MLSHLDHRVPWLQTTKTQQKMQLMCDFSIFFKLQLRQDMLIEFYSPMCGHCTHFAPTYAQIAQTLGNSGDALAARMDLYHHQVGKNSFGIFSAATWTSLFHMVMVCHGSHTKKPAVGAVHLTAGATLSQRCWLCNLELDLLSRENQKVGSTASDRFFFNGLKLEQLTVGFFPSNWDGKKT